jgi:hypothetical protein
MVRRVAAERSGTVAISALEDDGVGALQAAVEAALQVCPKPQTLNLAGPAAASWPALWRANGVCSVRFPQVWTPVWSRFMSMDDIVCRRCARCAKFVLCSDGAKDLCRVTKRELPLPRCREARG